MLELSLGRMLGVDKWTRATREDLEQAIVKRRARLDQEIDELLSLTGKNMIEFLMASYTQDERILSS